MLQGVVADVRVSDEEADGGDETRLTTKGAVDDGCACVEEVRAIQMERDES